MEAERKGLVRVYLLSFRFPSENLVVQSRLRMDKRYVYITSEARREPYLRLKSLRSKFQRLQKRFMYQSDFGWFAFDPAGVKQAREVLEEAKKLVRELRPGKEKEYYVDSIEVWLEPDQARRLYENARRRLLAGIASVEERIRRAEEQAKQTYLRSLRSEYRVLSSKLHDLIEQIRRLPAQQA